MEKIENFEKVNKKIVKNMYEFQLKIHEKTKKHNRKVIRVLENVKTRKIEEIQQKKQEFLYKTMNGQWKEQCRDLIFRSKTLWSQLIIFSSISYTLRTLLSRKKVIIKNVQKYIKFLRMISKILGIFMVLLRRKRKYLEYKTVKSFAPPLISHIAHEIKVHERAVNKIIWKIVNCNHLYLFMSFWKRSLYIVKRCIKRYLRVREARLVAMTHMLRKFGHNTVKDSRRVSLNTTSGLIGLGIAAQKRKKQIFSEFLRKFMQNHLATSKSSQQSLNFFSNIPQTATQLLSLISQPDSTRHRKRNTDIFNFN